jgi:hypothetical protein
MPDEPDALHAPAPSQQRGTPAAGTSRTTPPPIPPAGQCARARAPCWQCAGDRRQVPSNKALASQVGRQGRGTVRPAGPPSSPPRRAGLETDLAVANRAYRYRRSSLQGTVAAVVGLMSAQGPPTLWLLLLSYELASSSVQGQ